MLVVLKNKRSDNKYLLAAISVLIHILWRRLELTGVVWWGRRIPIACRHGPSWHIQRSAISGLQLHRGRPCLDECILNSAGDFCGKNWSRIHRARYRFLPGLQHGFHAFSCLAIYKSVRVHECRKESPSKVNCVRGANVLHDRVEYIKCRQLASRGSLQSGQSPILLEIICSI
jgi:hypothetical protein